MCTMMEEAPVVFELDAVPDKHTIATAKWNLRANVEYQEGAEREFVIFAAQEVFHQEAGSYGVYGYWYTRPGPCCNQADAMLRLEVYLYFEEDSPIASALVVDAREVHASPL